MYIDIILLAIIVLFTILGIKKGLIFEFFSLFGILITVLLSKQLINGIYPIVEKKFGDGNLGFVLTYVGTFISIYIFLYMILLITKKFFEKILLGWVDRLGGGIVGCLKGIVLSLVILIMVAVISNFNNDFKNYIQNSYSSKVIAKVIPYLKSFFPEDINLNMKNFSDDTVIKDTLEDILKKTQPNLDMDDIQKSIENSEKMDQLKNMKLDSKKIDIKDLQNKISDNTEGKGEEVDIDKLLDTVLEEYKNENN